MVLTSLTDFQKFNRDDAVDGAGVPFNSYQSIQTGKITSIYQELRLAGKWFDKGSWIVGANYEHDETYDHFLQTYNGSQSSPTNLPLSELCGPFSATSNCTLAEFPQMINGSGQVVANPNWNSGKYPTSFNYTLGPTATARRATDRHLRRLRERRISDHEQSDVGGRGPLHAGRQVG